MNNDTEDFIYTDNNGNAEMKDYWDWLEQESKRDVKNTLKPDNYEFCLRCQGKCHEVKL